MRVIECRHHGAYADIIGNLPRDAAGNGPSLFLRERKGWGCFVVFAP
jgi:hypothetical protein